MPRCSLPIPDDKYNKYNSIDGSYSCEVCPSIDDIMRDIPNFPSSPNFQNINSSNGKETIFREFLQVGADSTDPIMRNKYGDLLVNLNQCNNYSEYGIERETVEIEREFAQSEIKVDTGTWEILRDKTSDELVKCSGSESLGLNDTRMCEILNYYRESSDYLSPSQLERSIRNQFGTANQVMNNSVDYVLPPLPEELYSAGGSDIENYKRFIHQNRGSIISENTDVLNYLELTSSPPSENNIIMEEIYEAWIELNNFKKGQPRSMDTLDNLGIMNFFDGQPSSMEFEICMNNIFDDALNNKDYDYDIQEKISKHTDISQLTRQEVDYIEDKLKVIATLDPEKAMDCMNILNIGEMICDKGVSDRMLKMGYLVMHIIGLDKMNLKGISPGSEKYQKLKKILDRLTPYIRNAVKKIIEISKYYENQTCGYESASTHILETIYNDVFEKTKEVDVTIQGLDLIPTYLIKDTNMMEFAKTIILLIVMIAGIYVLMMILNRPVSAVKS